MTILKVEISNIGGSIIALTQTVTQILGCVYLQIK